MAIYTSLFLRFIVFWKKILSFENFNSYIISVHVIPILLVINTKINLKARLKTRLQRFKLEY